MCCASRFDFLTVPEGGEDEMDEELDEEAEDHGEAEGDFKETEQEAETEKETEKETETELPRPRTKKNKPLASRKRAVTPYVLWLQVFINIDSHELNHINACHVCRSKRKAIHG